MENFSSSNSTSSHQKQHLALRVALDTMKDRCILQQKRLSEVEEENQQLRDRLAQNTKAKGDGNDNANAQCQHNDAGVAENVQLRQQISELQRQNVQLNSHINMVSTENRKLWQRLSQIAKEQNKPIRDKDTTLMNISPGSSNEDSTTPRSGTGNQNLIRSKTFTQHSPNPNLRHKLISSDNCSSYDMLDVSLDTDVALEVFGDDSGKQQFVTDSESSVTHVAMGFGYLNVDDPSSNTASQEQDFNAEARKCLEGLQVMRIEAMKQQQELHSVFALLENRIALQPCSECLKKSKKPEMADKSLETDESFNDAKRFNHNTNAIDLKGVNADPLTKLSPVVQNNHLNIIQEKILADEAANMCPMCGKMYGSQVSFESFCEHVEEHFRDESVQEIEQSLEHNFELISHAVGDF